LPAARIFTNASPNPAIMRKDNEKKGEAGAPMDVFHRI
jgi:hypothetical protein